MWLTFCVLAFVKNRSAGNCGKNTQSHSPEVQRQTICSLRYLCLCIQQTFIENIPCAGDWMKLCPCLQDLIVEWRKQTWIKKKKRRKKGRNPDNQKTLNYVYGAWAVKRYVWLFLGNLRAIKIVVVEWVLSGEWKMVRYRRKRAPRLRKLWMCGLRSATPLKVWSLYAHRCVGHVGGQCSWYWETRVENQVGKG